MTWDELEAWVTAEANRLRGRNRWLANAARDLINDLCNEEELYV